MSQEIYILSLPGQSKPMYVKENGFPTYNLAEAKLHSSKFWLKLRRIITQEYRWWDIKCITKKTIFEARLKGK